MKTLLLALSLTAFASLSRADVSPLREPAYEFGRGKHTTLGGDLESTTADSTISHEALETDNSRHVTSHSSASAAATPGAGLIIDPSFDSSITNNPNSAAMQSTINEAISILQSLFSDSVRVSILFRYSTKSPDGAALDPDSIAQSYYVYYTGPWQGYFDALKADGKTPNDSAAYATLPPSQLSTNIKPASAAGRAIGLNTPPAMFADGNVGQGGPYDGIVTLNSGRQLQFTRPPGSNNYDALRSVQHEINEVLGIGSYLDHPGSDLRPQDVFSWSAAGVRNHTKSGRRYFSVDGGNTALVSLNQESPGDHGDWASGTCPQSSPLVQNAFSCEGQYSDVAATSPEGVTLDVLGYDLASAAPVQVTVDTTPSGRSFTVDGTPYNSTQTFSWGYGSSHTLGTLETQNGGEGVRYLWTDWSDGGSMSHSITATSSRTYTASFWTQYYLKISAGTGGSTTTQNSWHFSGDTLSISASPASGYNFAAWQGTGSGSYTGGNNPASITFNGPVTEKATFAATSSPTPTPSPTASPSRLQNISTRLDVRTGDDVLIGGFIISGNKPKKVMLRAIAPSLQLAGTLPNPTLELHYPDGSIVPNDDWKTDDATGLSQEASITATGIAPSNDLESALLRTLSPGAYTAVVKGKAGETGIGLIEAYDLASAAPSRLANISSRGFITAGDNVMIGGFIVGPATFAPSTVVLRALGPSVPVPNALQDPTIELHDSNGVTIASNDNWQDDSSAAELSSRQLAPTDPNESAMARVLAPGSYTAVVAAKEGKSGVGLVEIYNIR